MKSELAKRLDLSRELAQYDEHCKRILADKRVLVWIMRETIREFQSVEIDDIMKYIEGEPEISSVPAEPGMTNAPLIRGGNTEEKVPGEGAVYFDIRFPAGLPSGGRTTGVIINVEAQRGMRPGYSLVTRGFFYGARLISAQMGTEFTAPDYDRIKKVFSVWICFHAPGYVGNAISRYAARKEDIAAGIPDRPEEYDKCEVILICLNEAEKGGTRLTELLNLIFNSRQPYGEKEKILTEEYGFQMETGIGKELRDMCNVSGYILEQALEEGMQKGMQKGMRQGMQKGMQKGMQQGIQKIIRNMVIAGYTDEQILEICEVTPEQLENMRQEI